MSHLPNGLTLLVEYAHPVAPLVLAEGYASLLRDAGCGEVKRCEVYDLNGDRVGAFPKLDNALPHLGANTHAFKLVMRDGTDANVSRSNHGGWDAVVSAPGKATERWLAGAVGIARAAMALPAFARLHLKRQGTGGTLFVPLPPIAREYHMVTTTDEEVAIAYDNPDVFWRGWKTTEQIGAHRLCVRAMASLAEEDWLESTLLSTMELARHARPGLTQYKNAVWVDWLEPWWAFGDIQEERAGYPALTLVGYDEATRVVLFGGSITRRPLIEGGEEARHVLIAEIHPIREFVLAGETEDGQPISSVQVVFREEWMARQERRPLLDVGARVFYLGDDGEPVAVID